MPIPGSPTEVPDFAAGANAIFMEHTNGAASSSSSGATHSENNVAVVHPISIAGRGSGAVGRDENSEAHGELILFFFRLQYVAFASVTTATYRSLKMDFRVIFRSLEELTC